VCWNGSSISLSFTLWVAVINRRATNTERAGPLQEYSFGAPNYYDWCWIAMTTVRVVVVHAVCGWFIFQGQQRQQDTCGAAELLVY
jgi:hypothetical protein